MFFSDASRIIVVLTKTGFLGKKKNDVVKSWCTELKKYGIEYIFTAGEDGIDEKE